MGSTMDTDQLKNTATNLSTGNKILGGSATVALVATFLPWYKFDVPFAEGVGFAGRQFTFGWMGMVLLVAAAALVLAPAFGAKQVQTNTLRTEQIALVSAGLGMLLWLVRLASLPGFNAFNTLQRSFGLYVAIIAAAGVVYGVIASMKEKGIAMPTVADFKDTKVDLTTPAAPAPVAAAPAPAPAPTVPPAPAPVHQAPLHQAPVHQPPVANQPVAPAPTHQPPAHQPPVAQPPAHQPPTVTEF